MFVCFEKGGAFRNKSALLHSANVYYNCSRAVPGRPSPTPLPSVSSTHAFHLI